ncbi:hypothetical protein [Rhizobium rhizogenes]|uniref:hypothetical protein n=1 Tax=Rhizobium rhizogenes TaxID=359 RepID=UPI001F4070A6|nr:hypothetical protein [Rhizobium rhizogenes]
MASAQTNEASATLSITAKVRPAKSPDDAISTNDDPSVFSRETTVLVTLANIMIGSANWVREKAGFGPIFRRASCEPLEPIPPQRTLICLNFQGWQPGRKRQAHDGSMSFC